MCIYAYRLVKILKNPITGVINIHIFSPPSVYVCECTYEIRRCLAIAVPPRGDSALKVLAVRRKIALQQRLDDIVIALIDDGVSIRKNSRNRHTRRQLYSPIAATDAQQSKNTAKP